MQKFVQKNRIKIFFVICLGIIAIIFLVQKLTMKEMNRVESYSAQNIQPASTSVSNRPLTMSLDNHIITPEPEVINADQVPKPAKSSTNSESKSSQRVYEKPSRDIFLPQ
jgi:hypothetical protein